MAYKNKNGINKTHGMSKTRLYQIWSQMKQRCSKKTENDWVNYGGRGIKVCEEWGKSFETFMKWAYENGYAENLTIDRINVDGNYEPSNCRWITIEEQQANKTNTIKIFYNGQERCLRTVCLEIGFPYKTAHRRYQRWKEKGVEINTEKLFSPVQENKIAFRYRN